MDKYVNILGFGVTNKALVTLLNQHNITCKIYDDAYKTDTKDSHGNTYYPFRVVASLHAQNPNGDTNPALISPGIAPNAPFLSYFKNIISEYDCIYRIISGLSKKLFSVWISGTNGKTTTTEMLSCMLEAKSGGNIGIPLATLFMQDFATSPLHWNLLQQDTTQNHEVYNVPNLCEKDALWVLETSSFTLHYSHYSLPNLYVLLPLSQDHISWHGSFESYIADKLKPLSLMNHASNPKQHFAFVPKDLLQHKIAKEIIENALCNIYLYTDSEELQSYLQCDVKLYNLFKEPFCFDFMVAASSLKFAEIPYSITNIKEYRIGAYRMEETNHKGITFVNDSKATNPHAVLAALTTYKDFRIYLILGGDSKGADISMIYPFLEEHDIKVFTIGCDGAMIAKACKKRHIWVQECATLTNAMQAISTQLHMDSNNQNNADKKPAIMLSPACASLDQYISYKARGEEFDRLVKEIFVCPL